MNLGNFLNKESSHRSHELKAIGWNIEDISRYEELWEYSQRWGLINLEREDRQFLKKAEKLIPKIQPKKTSNKKSIEEKSYFLWLNFYFNKLKAFSNLYVPKDMCSVWEIMIEGELNLLKKYNPVMGLPDAVKAKELYKVRASLLQKSYSNYEARNCNTLFDFDIEKISSEEDVIGKSWKSLIESDPSQKDQFPLLNQKNAAKLKTEILKTLEEFIITNYPSLKDIL